MRHVGPVSQGPGRLRVHQSATPPREAIALGAKLLAIAGLAVGEPLMLVTPAGLQQVIAALCHKQDKQHP